MNELMGRNQGQIAQYQESKELSEIKGKMFLARQFPRDPEYSRQAAIAECKRKELAEHAMYEFSKGDGVVRGPSIRLVEVMARHWGNITCGVDEIDSKDGETTIKSYAWDLETNVSDSKTFTVKHERVVGKGDNKRTKSSLTSGTSTRRWRTKAPVGSMPACWPCSPGGMWTLA